MTLLCKPIPSNGIARYGSFDGFWNRTRRSDRTDRRAVTLIEVLLVLAILAAIAGFAIPTIESMITSRKLVQALDAVANDLAEARVKAIRTGQAQVFEATLGGRDYSITPWLGANDEIDAAAGATVTTSTGLTLETEAVSGGGVATSAASSNPDDIRQVVDGVQFYAVDTLLDTRSAVAVQSTGGTAAVQGGTSSPILLYPDGTATTAQIALVDLKGRRWVIQIRGVVGQMKKFQIASVDPASITEAP
jgi:prepilin-type N-terminal cleavage/methylation domain-containing protein